MTRSRPPAWRRYLRFWGSNVESDVDDELRLHIELRAELLISQGMSPREARRVAEERFGSVERAHDACVGIQTDHARQEHRMSILASLRQDFAFAVRMLRRQAGATLIAATCIALGIGATTTMFSVANTLLLRPMPFPNGDRLYMLSSVRAREGDVRVTSYADYIDWRRMQRSFSEIAAVGTTNFAIGLAKPVRAVGAVVSANFFRTLGVTPERGRLFLDGEDVQGGPMIAIVSRGFAERQLGGVDHALGATISVRDLPRTIVGIVPDESAFPANGEVWLLIPRELDIRRGNRNLQIIGLIKPGVTPDQARAELASIEAELVRENPVDDAGLSATVVPLRERFIGAAHPTLVAMIMATVLVLLVACANVAGIQLARATTRVREISIRSALGANRSRMFRQLLTESIVLALAGGVLGVVIAYRSAAFAGRSAIGLTPRWLVPSIDPLVLIFAVVISVITGVVFGVVPAMRLTRVDPADVLRGGRSAGPGRARLQQLCVVVQITLSIVLLVAAGLAIQSARQIQRIPLGFDTSDVLVFSASMQTPRYDAPGAKAQFISTLTDRMKALPGVIGAGAVTLPPLRCCSQWALDVEGHPTPAGQKFMVTGNSVTPGYFRAMGVTLLRGRDFSLTDARDAQPVIIINETFANRYWPAGDAPGHFIHVGGARALVVGVVNDVKQGGILDAPEPQFYQPVAQSVMANTAFVVRTSAGDPTRLVGDIRAIVHELDPALPIYNAVTMRKMVDDALVSRRTFESVMIAFGVVALLLAAAGVFAVTSFIVAQRTQEMGVRLALGAEPARVVAYVMRGSALLWTVGIVAGLLGAMIAARWMAHSLYGVSAGEPAIYTGAVGVLVVAAFIATLAPARRAANVDPVIALRAEG